MTSIVTSILNSTVGLLWNKVRDSTAAKLQDGDVTDAKIREIVVRELNDIKTKLDGLSRKDLLSSYRFLKQGVELLNVSLDQSTYSSTMSSGVQSATLNEVLELAHAVEKVKVKSCAEYESAKERFKYARVKATEAFSNEALGIEDRILAAKLQVVSEILENLESPTTAITGCLSFLRDLHSLPAIREIFSVFLNGGMKSWLGKEERTANVKSVMLINCVIFQFTLKFGGKLTDRLTWPAGTIEIAGRSFNPVLEWQKVSLRKSMTVGGELGQPPNELLHDEEICPRLSAVNSRGEIVVKHNGGEIKIISRTGETKVVKLPEPTEGKLIKRRIASLGIDVSNNIYVVTYLITTRAENVDVIITYVLHVLDDSYSVKHVGTLNFYEKISHFSYMNIAINKNNDIILTRDDDYCVYVSDNSGKLKHKFARDRSLLGNVCAPKKNEIMIPSEDSKAVKFYTEKGNMTSTIKVPEGHRVYGMAFHHLIGKIIMLTYSWKEKRSCFLLCYSEAGELESSTYFCEVIKSWFPFITSHPAGPVAVVKENSVTFI